MSAKDLAKLKKNLKKVKVRSKAEIEDDSVEVQKKREKFKERTIKFRGVDKKKKKRFTSEPIPDYIMRAIQPKKSVHPVYGKLRF